LEFGRIEKIYALPRSDAELRERVFSWHLEIAEVVAASRDECRGNPAYGDGRERSASQRLLLKGLVIKKSRRRVQCCVVRPW
jgi:hypothetical protein